MPRDCPHNRCHFFVDSGAASCPGCGGALRPFGADWVHILRTALSPGRLLLATLPLLAWRFAGGWVGLGLAVVLCLAAVVAWALAAHSKQRKLVAGSLDARYLLAANEAQRWLETWSALFALASDLSDSFEDERQLIIEAQVAAAEAASEACRLRNEYADLYIRNGFDRLHLLSEARSERPLPTWEAQRRHAIAIIEHYVENLWVDAESIDRVRTDLRELQATDCRRAQQHDLITLVSTVRLFDSSRPESTGTLLRCDDAVEAEFHRLRAERALLRDAPRL